MAIPRFRANGYLPEGVHRATIEEVSKRFGESTTQRRRLMIRLRRWTNLARKVMAKRLLIDGSFVTSKSDPNDVDAVVQLTLVYYSMLAQGNDDALELFDVLTKRQPEELFAAEDNVDWNDWVEFFGRTRELNRSRKGLIEVIL